MTQAISNPAPSAPKRRTLFVITEDLLVIEDMIGNLEGDISDPEAGPIIIEWLEKIGAEEAQKLDGYINLLKTWDNEASAMKAEAEIYAKKQKTLQNRIEYFKGRLYDHLKKTNRVKLTTAAGRNISIVKNGGVAPMWIDPNIRVDSLPEKYHKVLEPQLNVEAVRGELMTLSAEDAAKAIPFAKLLPRGDHLTIK